jgi:hypothetical protein
MVVADRSAFPHAEYQSHKASPGLDTMAYIAVKLHAGILANPSNTKTPEVAADEAVKHAAALIERLNK